MGFMLDRIQLLQVSRVSNVELLADRLEIAQTELMVLASRDIGN